MLDTDEERECTTMVGPSKLATADASADGSAVAGGGTAETTADATADASMAMPAEEALMTGATCRDSSSEISSFSSSSTASRTDRLPRIDPKISGAGWEWRRHAPWIRRAQ